MVCQELVANRAPTPEGDNGNHRTHHCHHRHHQHPSPFLLPELFCSFGNASEQAHMKRQAPVGGKKKAPVVFFAEFHKINEKRRWGTMKTLSHMHPARGHLAQTQAPNLCPLVPLPLVPLPETLLRPIVPLFRWWHKPFFATAICSYVDSIF